MTNTIKRRCTAFGSPDFINKGNYKDALTIANRIHDVVAIQVYDRRDAELPKVGLMKVKDAETGKMMDRQFCCQCSQCFCRMEQTSVDHGRDLQEMSRRFYLHSVQKMIMWSPYWLCSNNEIENMQMKGIKKMYYCCYLLMFVGSNAFVQKTLIDVSMDPSSICLLASRQWYISQ